MIEITYEFYALIMDEFVLWKQIKSINHLIRETYQNSITIGFLSMIITQKLDKRLRGQGQGMLL